MVRRRKYYSSKKVSLSGIRDHMRNISLTVKVDKIITSKYVTTRAGERVKIKEAQVSDESGSGIMVFWGEKGDDINEGDIIDVRNAYTTSFRGEVRINVGRYSKITKH